MGLILAPEIKMARRIIQKNSLSVPFDLNYIVEQYAEVIYKPIPLEGVDGLCFNLKTPGKKPTVIINSNGPKTRQKFTLAHELGHIIIPWHYGAFIDELEENISSTNHRYLQLEREANKFASELLMPFDLLFSLYKKNPEPDAIVMQLSRLCGVSEMAAGIRVYSGLHEIESIMVPLKQIIELYAKHNNLAGVQRDIVSSTSFSSQQAAKHIIKSLTGNIAYCVEKDGIVMDCGSTVNTHSHFQFEGEKFISNPYPHYKQYDVFHFKNVKTHWWTLDMNIDIREDDRSWKEILHQIACDIAPSNGVDAFKVTVNAKLSGANGNWKIKNPGLGNDKFIEDAMQRFNNSEYRKFALHPLFGLFIKKRCEAFSQNIKK